MRVGEPVIGFQNSQAGREPRAGRVPRVNVLGPQLVLWCFAYLLSLKTMPEVSLESARNRVGKSFSFICFLVDRLQEHLCFSQPDQHINIYNQLFLAQKTCYRLWKQGAYALPHRSLWELVCGSNFGEQINESWEPQGQVASQYHLAHWLGSVLIVFLLFIMLAKYEHVSPILWSPSSEMSTALTALLSATFLNCAGSKRCVSGERQTKWTGPHLFHTSVKGFQLSSVSRACFIEKRIGCCLAGLGKPFFKNFPVFFFSQLNRIWASVSPRIRELDGSPEFTSWSQTSSLTGGDGRTKCGILWLQGGLAEPSSNSDSVQESRNAKCPWYPQLWCASQATRQSPRSPLPKDALLAQQLYKCHWERWQA